MAHVAKFNKGAIGHMLSHYDRSKDGLGENVDHERTHLNYNLAQDSQPMKQLDFLHKRLREVKVQNRKDVNVLCDWVVTAPKDLPEQEYKAFFQASYDFLKMRYGWDNVVSAYVHMDETTPHLHFAFIPVKHGFKEDKKNPDISTEYKKVSAKEVITRYDLKTFHQDLSNYLKRQLGYEIGILNEATREGNKSIEELKRQSATERLQEINLKASKMLSKAEEGIKILKQQEKVLQGQIEGLQRDILTAQQVKEMPNSKTLIGNKRVLAADDFERLCKTAATAEELLKEIRPARKIYAQAQEILQNAQIQANSIVKQAQDRAHSLLEKMDSIKYLKELEHMEKVINSNPQLLKSYQQIEKDLLARQKTKTHQRNFDKER